jgi:hypothetical protein
VPGFGDAVTVEVQPDDGEVLALLQAARGGAHRDERSWFTGRTEEASMVDGTTAGQDSWQRGHGVADGFIVRM